MAQGTVTKTPREITEARLAGNGRVVKSFKSVNRGGVAPLDGFNTVDENKVYTVPKDFRIFELPINGTTNVYYVVVAEDGTQIPSSMFDKSVQPADGGERVKPTGTVVDLFQGFGDRDEAFAAIAGRPFNSGKRVPVVGKVRGSEETYETSVWQEINFVQ